MPGTRNCGHPTPDLIIDDFAPICKYSDAEYGILLADSRFFFAMSGCFRGIFGLFACLLSVHAGAQSGDSPPGQAEFGALNRAFEVSPAQRAALDEFTAAFARIARDTNDPDALSALQSELIATLRRLQAPLHEAATEVHDALQDALITVRHNDLFGPTDEPSLGQGELLVVEFFDYQCGYCKRMLPTVLAAVETQAVRVRIKEFPVLGPASELAARYALAAHKQGHYAEFHTRLVQEDGPLSREYLQALAADIGMDVTRLTRDADSAETTRILAENHRLGRDLGIRGTPAFFIGDTPVYGALPEEDFMRLVVEAKAAARSG